MFEVHFYIGSEYWERLGYENSPMTGRWWEEAMYPVPGRCPVCGQELSVTRLHCRSCDSTLEGNFELGRFHQLSPDQLHFVETFIRCEGKLNKVQEEVKLSYPTVRSRLLDVIRALGYEVHEELTVSPEQRKVILDDLAQGKITSEEAIRLLQGD